MRKDVALILCLTSALLGGCAVDGSAPAVGQTQAALREETSEPILLPDPFTATPSPTPLPTPPATPIASTSGQAAAMLPEYSKDVARFPNATRYWIEVEVSFDPEGEQARLDGMARIRFTNASSKALREIPIMLWPNHEQYASVMTVEPALVEGRLVELEQGEIDVSMQVPLHEALPAGESVDISLPFQISADRIMASTPQRFGIAGGVLIAPTFYPLIPPLQNGEWRIETAPPGGDTTTSQVSFYEVTIRVPHEFSVAATGVEDESHEPREGISETTFVSGPVRDVAFAAGPLIAQTRTVGQVLLRAWVLPEHEQDLEVVLDAAAEQVALLEEWVGPYPYKELDLVDAPGAFGGIEYPGLVFLGTLGSAWVVEPTVHEVAHQWFYGLIGNDQIREPWLDEAAATYAEALYYERVFGTGRATSFLRQLRAVLRSHPDPAQPIGLPVGEYESVRDYSLFVYFKGALFFDALRQRLGEQTFRDFLASYDEAYRYAIADGLGFQELAEEACSCSLDDLFDSWVFEGGELSVP
jgi:hypothetical protein